MPFFKAPVKQFTAEEIAEKIKYYCRYQERCINEVKEKLYSFGLTKPDAEKMLATITAQGYVNEERFAIAFASGKFRLNKWGKQKIKNALQQKRVNNYCISKAINSINANAYAEVCNALAEKKLKALSATKNIFEKRKKLTDYLLQKGFEMQRIQAFIKNIS